MNIKTVNMIAQFVSVGQVLDFQIERDVVGKCKVISTNKETNEIELELDDEATPHAEDFISQ